MTTTTQSYTPAPATVRPLGVTILAVLNALSGLAFLASGAGAMAVGASVGSIFAALGMFIGVILILIGLFQLFVAWGLWSGKKWAWFLALIFGILGVLFGLVGLIGGNITSVLSLLISAVIVYYLYTQPVKAFFGR